MCGARLRQGGSAASLHAPSSSDHLQSRRPRPRWRPRRRSTGTSQRVCPHGTRIAPSCGDVGNVEPRFWTGALPSGPEPGRTCLHARNQRAKEDGSGGRRSSWRLRSWPMPGPVASWCCRAYPSALASTGRSIHPDLETMTVSERSAPDVLGAQALASRRRSSAPALNTPMPLQASASSRVVAPLQAYRTRGEQVLPGFENPL